MSAPDRFKPYTPDVQAVVRLEEALPPEHPVHVFIDLVRSVDLGHFVIPPGPKGEKPYHPHALFGILVWGYLHGVRSARKLARRRGRRKSMMGESRVALSQTYATSTHAGRAVPALESSRTGRPTWHPGMGRQRVRRDRGNGIDGRVLVVARLHAI